MKNLIKATLFFLICCCLLMSAYSLADQNKLDSLHQLIKTATQDTIRINTLNQLCREYWFNDPDKAMGFGNKALSITEKTKYYKGKGDSYNNIATVHLIQGNYPIALKYYSISIKTYEENGLRSLMAPPYNNIGIIYDYQGDYEKAIDYHLKSLTIREEINDKKGMAMSYNNIGAIYFNQKNYKKTLDYYMKALSIYEEVGDKTQAIANTLTNIGNVYNRQKNHTKTLEYYQNSLTVFEEIGDKKGISVTYSNIGSVYAEQAAYLSDEKVKSDIYERALYYQLKGLRMKEEMGDKLGLTYTFRSIGDLHLQKGELTKAITLFSKSATLADEIGAKVELMKAYKSLSNGYVQQYNHKKAYAYYKLSSEIKDSLYNEDKAKEIGKLEAKYEMEKKIAEEKRLADEQTRIKVTRIKRRNILQYSSILIVIVILSLSLFMLGRLNIGIRMLEGMTFITFLIIFETVLVLLDPYIEIWTGGEPAYKLAINAGLAGVIFPLHQFFEGLLKRRIIKSK